MQLLSVQDHATVVDKGPIEARMEVDEANVYVHKYLRDDAVPNVEWALDYWRGLRTATPTKNQNKCRLCEYREDCDEKIET